MTPRKADQLIKTGKPVTVRNTHFNETFTITIIRRDRWNVYADNGGCFDRGELEVIKVND